MIPTRLSELEETLDVLLSEVDMLGQRLSAVLTNDEQLRDPQVGRAPSPPQSDLANALHSSCERVDSVIRQLRSIRGAVDL